MKADGRRGAARGAVGEGMHIWLLTPAGGHAGRCVRPVEGVCILSGGRRAGHNAPRVRLQSQEVKLCIPSPPGSPRRSPPACASRLGGTGCGRDILGTRQFEGATEYGCDNLRDMGYWRGFDNLFFVIYMPHFAGYLFGDIIFSFLYVFLYVFIL